MLYVVFAYVPWKHKSETPHWDWPQKTLAVCNQKSLFFK